MEKGAVTASAPGKVILAGEHAVVYGYPAIVAAIDRRLTIIVRPGKKSKRYTGLVKFALSQILKPGEVVDLKIKSKLPIGSGLGSSAALATALVWALKPSLSVNAKNRLVKIIEDYQHGQSSGVDQAILRQGGALKFQKGKFKTIKLKAKQAILIDSGRPKETTGEMVKRVAEKKPVTILKKIGQIADNWSQGLIKENEWLLEELGVVGQQAQKIIRQIEAIGGMAKVCGAGGVKAGSGMLLSYHQDQGKLLKLIKQKHWRYLKVSLGEPGVRYEKN
jgi:mevalonate kinase